MDVVLPTRTGIEIRRRCVSKPTDHQAIHHHHHHHHHLSLNLPTQSKPTDL